MLRDTAEEEGEMYFSFASAPILYVTPRNAAGHGRGRGLVLDFVAVAVFQPLCPSDTSPIFCCAKHRGGGLKVVFLCFNPLALLGIFLYIVTEILEEKGVILLLL